MSKAAMTVALGAAGALMLAPAPAAHAADPIKVGVVTPLSGSYAPIGKQVRWGAELAVKEINAAGGVNGRPFELLFEDEEASPPVAVRKSEKLLQQDKVDLLTGTVNSGSTLAVGQLAERNNRILVTTVSYAPSITGSQCNPNVFRVNANAFMQSNALTNWLIKNVSGKRYFFIGPDYEMGRSTISAFQDDIKRLGGTDVGATYPPLGAKDFTPYVGQIRAARPDVIMTATAGNDTVRLLTQLKEYGILSDKLTLAGAAGAVTQEIIGAMGGAGEGLPERCRLFDRHRHAGQQEIRRRFQEGLPERTPTCSRPIPTDCSTCSSRRSRRPAAPIPDKLRVAMEDASWETPQGTKKIRKGDHQAVVDMVVVKVKGNDFQTVGKVSGTEAVGPDKCEKF